MDKTALVTGTTSGIGRALCDKLAQENYRLVLVARNKALLKEQAETLRSSGVKVFEVVCNLAKPNAAEMVLSAIRSENLMVDVLINNAGFNEAGLFSETNLDKELEMIQVHIKTLTELTKGMLTGMLERRRGKILNVGSTGSYMPCPTDAVYAATKAYVLSFSNALYQELKGTGVTVTTLCPGATETNFADKAAIDKTLLFKYFVMQPEKVANIGYASMLKGKRTVTAGAYNKMLVAFSKLLPIKILNPIAAMMIKK